MKTVDLGEGFSYSFTSWHPDRKLNPHLAHLPDIEQVGIILWKDGAAIGHCSFDKPDVRVVFPDRPVWQVVSLDPLHIEPSIQTYKSDGKTPEFHGFIRNGRWQWA